MQVSDGLSAGTYEKMLEDACRAKIGSQMGGFMQSKSAKNVRWC